MCPIGQNLSIQTSPKEVCLKSVCVWKSAGITITNVFNSGDSGERVEMRLRLLHALGLPQVRLALYCDTGLT